MEKSLYPRRTLSILSPSPRRTPLRVFRRTWIGIVVGVWGVVVGTAAVEAVSASEEPAALEPVSAEPAATDDPSPSTDEAKGERGWRAATQRVESGAQGVESGASRVESGAPRIGSAAPRAEFAAPDSSLPRNSAPLSNAGRALRSVWARNLGGPATSALTLSYPGAVGQIGPGSGLVYYPREGVRTVEGLALSQQQAFLYGVRKFDLTRSGTALKGASLVGNVGLFAGAFASSFGWLTESQGLWLAGGAAALGAAYGAAVGYENSAFREEWRWPDPVEDEPGTHIRVRAR